MDLTDAIRTIPDYPKTGILFRDITTLLGDAAAFRQAVDDWPRLKDLGITKVAGLEARGFILGGAIAHQLGAGFIPLRKRGKLPHRTYAVEYALEYGVDSLEMHCDACETGERIFLIDDLIATGGTALAEIQAPAPGRRRGGGGGLCHRPARPRRRGPRAGGGRAGQGSGRIPRPLIRIFSRVGAAGPELR